MLSGSSLCGHRPAPGSAVECDEGLSPLPHCPDLALFVPSTSARFSDRCLRTSSSHGEALQSEQGGPAVTHPKNSVGWATIHLAPPIIGLYVRYFYSYKIHCGGQLILRKISKIGATGCQIFRLSLKCTKFVFPADGELIQCSPNL